MSARPQLRQVLVAFADFNGYTKHAATLPPLALFELFSDYARYASTQLAASGGTLVKVIGDALLVVFPEEHAAAGVVALLELKQASEAWMAQRGFRTRMVLKVHFGEAAVGDFGGDGRLDVYGSTVNTAATLDGRGVSLSAQAFRTLGPAERKRFKKHTAPIIYIPIEERHS